MKRIVLFLITMYSAYISKILHGFSRSLGIAVDCRFQPSCSKYLYDAVSGHGIIRGLYLGVRRILRCHPFSKGGHDPVPTK